MLYRRVLETLVAVLTLTMVSSSSLRTAERTAALADLPRVRLGKSTVCEVDPPEVDKPKPEGGLDDAALNKMLDNMGYSPKKLSKGYLVEVKSGTWTLNVQLVLSGDLTIIGLNANLGSVEKPEEVTSEQWRKLLESNAEIDPSSFYFDKTAKKVYLHRTLSNTNVTPAVLRRQIENFTANIIATADLWKFTK